MAITREQAIEKIQKLLALANGTDKEGEMKNAMRLAQAFLRKHDLEMSDVELQEEIQDMVTEPGMEFTRTYQWMWSIAHAIDCVCTTNHFRSGHGWNFRMHFCGTKTDVATATELFKFLYDTIQAMGKAAHYPSIRERNSYCNGIGYRVHQRAKELVVEEPEGEMDQIDGERCKAIMVVKEKELTEYMEREHNIRTIKAKTSNGSMSAFMHGVMDGENVPLSVNPKLEG